MSGGQSLIWTEVDYERAGKQIGFLHLPHSVTRSAYGVIRIPIAVIRNGSGPTLLLMAGNHGDEYEGQIALTRFIGAVDPGAVQGRIIVLPAANLPAALAGTRTSPLDNGNLNRSFPGDPEGGPTAAIAHYVASVLFPLCDALQDYHAGGASLHYLPFASVRLSRVIPISIGARSRRSRPSRRRSPRSGPRRPIRGSRRRRRSPASSWRSAASSAAAATSRPSASA